MTGDTRCQVLAVSQAGSGERSAEGGEPEGEGKKRYRPALERRWSPVLGCSVTLAARATLVARARLLPHPGPLSLTLPSPKGRGELQQAI